jgi:membrane protein DedA with SNARE-associated domain
MTVPATATNAPIAMDTVLTFIGTLDATGLDTVFSAIVKRAGKLARDAGGYAAGRYFADPGDIIKASTFEQATVIERKSFDKKATAEAE